MSKNYKGFTPNWYEEEAPKNSYRSILKWGDVNEFKHPNWRLYTLMKKTFDMRDEDFKDKEKMGLESVSYDLPISLTKEQIQHFKDIVSEENVLEDQYSRLQVAYGKTIDRKSVV